MQNWEYAVVTFEKGLFQGIYSPDGNKQFEKKDGHLIMNDLGKNGWEAVCTIPGPGQEGDRLLLKRPAAAKAVKTRIGRV
jgi:hypothetical protein